MILSIKKCIILLSILLVPIYVYSSNNAGSRASFTRTGWVGTRYIAMGKAAEVVVNDVFAIYWNPAGLMDIQGPTALTLDEIKQKAKQGEVDTISEKELLTFSQDESSFNVLQIGVSGGMVAAQRYAGFGGIAYKFGGNALGFGLYSIQSPNIDTYDINGNKTGTTKYSANVGMFSYATYIGDAAVGLTIKALYETIAEASYTGAGMDIGFITEIIPFLKVGLVIQDIGTGLYPTNDYYYIVKKYDYGSPSIKISSAIISRSNNMIISFSGIKKIEQNKYEYNLGIELVVYKSLTASIGLNNSLLTTGCSIEIGDCTIGYAFAYDSIDLGCNNFVSIMLAL